MSSISGEGEKKDDVSMSGDEMSNLKISTLSQEKSIIERAVEEGGIISEAFFGQLETFIEFTDKSGKDQTIKIKEAFAEVLLNVIGIKDLYEAWENHY